MKHRSVFLMMLVAALVLGVVGNAFAQDDALVIWADETRAPILEDLGADFEAEFGVAVVVQEYGFGDIRDNFKTAAPAGEGPDIIVGAHDWLGELVVNSLLQPLEFGEEVEAEFLPAALQAFVYEGALYGMPYATENVAFVRNPELVPDAPATWDDVRALSEELTDGEGSYGYIIQDSDPYHFFPIQTAFGGYVFGVTEEGYDAEDLGIDSEGAIAAATWLEGMADDGLMPTGVDYDVMHSLFTNGEAAMIVTGPWAIGQIQDSGIPFEVSGLPAGPDEVTGKPFLGVQGFMVSAFSEKQLLAETFLIDYVATSEAMQAIFDADPRPSAYLPVRESVEDPILQGFIDAGAEGLAMPAIPAMSSVWTSWGDALSLIRNDELSGEEAFATAAEQIRTLLVESE
jgi:maltose-binding protein MalE